MSTRSGRGIHCANIAQQRLTPRRTYELSIHRRADSADRCRRDGLHRDDGWAVTGGVLANKANPDMGAPTSFVFEQEGQFWVVKDKAKVCGTNPTTTTAPADALIPATLFLPGCAAG